MKLTKNKFLSLLGAVAVVAAPDVTYAAGAATLTGVSPDNTNFADAKRQVQSWAVGDLGIAASTAGGLFGLFHAVGGNIKMAAVGAGIAFLGAFSPAIVQSIYGAVI